MGLRTLRLVELSYQFVVVFAEVQWLVICESQQQVVQMTTTKGQAVSLKTVYFHYLF